ncbi:MAG TPA: 6-phosphogluconolactonase [Candidatus Corynebacterium faecigallinarum]|uniref:6-phosphogluconolactonase n=1 Tax=Candidatus Corynebacterium faecigallinarum TaxID=2838528 RepID=A0A9D2TNA8_9CORY|nr:6-phosphogluconolactonase [Candidatus Corynebacterium faecigallinarum]
MTTRSVSVTAWPDQDTLAEGVARDIVEVIAEVQRRGGVTDDGFARIVLTGGGAGGAVLRALAALDLAARQTAESFPVTAIDWSKVHVFFGDERFVPVGTTGAVARNDGLADTELLEHVGIPAQHVHRVAAPTDAESPDGPELDTAASEYATVLGEYAPEGFDLHLLGMGPEGHINSLFPHTPELSPADGTTVVAVRGCPKPPAERVSLTLAAVNSAQRVWLLVCGAAKKDAADHVVSGDDPAQWPAAAVCGTSETVLHVDAGADPR